jgi:hypothetical protein
MYDHVNLQAMAQKFAEELRKAIASQTYTPADVQHLRRVLGNVEKITNG